MKISFKKNYQIIVHTKGMTKEDILQQLKRRVNKYNEEMNKREWIYKEYLKYKEKRDAETEWIKYIENDEIKFDN